MGWDGMVYVAWNGVKWGKMGWDGVCSVGWGVKVGGGWYSV